MLAEIPSFLIEIIAVIVLVAVSFLFYSIRDKIKSAETEDLYSACMFGDLEKARDCLAKEKKIDLNDNEDNMNDYSFLSAAVHGGNPEIVGLLVSRGADVNNDFIWSGLPLNAAIESESVPMAELLLKLGADPNKQPELQLYPLLQASDMGHADLVRLLVSYGADVNMQDEDGDTAAHMAADAEHNEVVHLLIELGARSDLKNNEGLTVHDILRRNREMMDHESEMG